MIDIRTLLGRFNMMLVGLAMILQINLSFLRIMTMRINSWTTKVRWRKKERVDWTISTCRGTLTSLVPKSWPKNQWTGAKAEGPVNKVLWAVSLISKKTNKVKMKEVVYSLVHEIRTAYKRYRRTIVPYLKILRQKNKNLIRPIILDWFYKTHPK